MAKLEHVLGSIFDTDDPIDDFVSAVGTWLNKARTSASKTVQELSNESGISVPGIYNIESGRTPNPRQETIAKLETALEASLPQDVKDVVKDEATIQGVGEFFDFDPHANGELPDVSGIYVFYDISERPIYVGQGKSISKRIRDHEDKFWFKSPIVENASYVEIQDKKLRENVEAVLIKFLKRNAVINKQHVHR